jgi:hypothetical protein
MGLMQGFFGNKAGLGGSGSFYERAIQSKGKELQARASIQPGQKRISETEITAPDKTVGGGISATAGGAIAGATIGSSIASGATVGGMGGGGWGAVAGGVIGLAAYFLS